ncbi:MAG TPA: glycogen debranching enzyme N-terminal domain-containing protein, partial [Cyclobacteriaceae bacterium]|nr:glycogen debranching enzyme N-terminal domain-containing protein [Cyclobacteriaceae bacterium]
MRVDSDQTTSSNFEKLRSLEWLETNGLGGYASSTISGANTRRYHALLVAATNPPTERTVILSKLDETVITADQRIELGTNQYPGAIHPRGFQFLKDFQRNLFPEFTYEVAGIRIKKTIAALHGENTTVIVYEVIAAPSKFRLELLPLCSSRDHHGICSANDSLYTGYLFDDSIFQTKNYQGSPELFISVPKSTFIPTQQWYYNFEYAIEAERGLSFREDLFNHGKFEIDLEQGMKLGIIISTADPGGRDGVQLLYKEEKRREVLTRRYPPDSPLHRLTLAADQFIVKRGTDLKSIIAGYPWFSDWGRDTMIALPGLCLATERFEDARKIILAFAENESEGMIPNRFPDHGEQPEYNSVDATLWFFVAIYKYYTATRDIRFVKNLLPVLQSIADHHFKGTR